MLNKNEVRDAFEAAIILATTYRPTVLAIAKALQLKKTIMTLVHQFVARKTRTKVNEAVQQSVISIPSSLSPTPEQSFTFAQD